MGGRARVERSPFLISAVCDRWMVVRREMKSLRSLSFEMAILVVGGQEREKTVSSLEIQSSNFLLLPRLSSPLSPNTHHVRIHTINNQPSLRLSRRAHRSSSYSEILRLLSLRSSTSFSDSPSGHFDAQLASTCYHHSSVCPDSRISLPGILLLCKFSQQHPS